jgi:hypothetical protein
VCSSHMRLHERFNTFKLFISSDGDGQRVIPQNVEIFCG